MSEYKVVPGLGLPALQEIVIGMMALGWEPQGGVAVAVEGYYLQAMVRYPAYVPKGRELMKGEGNG
jgi:hypothetical protein